MSSRKISIRALEDNTELYLECSAKYINCCVYFPKLADSHNPQLLSWLRKPFIVANDRDKNSVFWAPNQMKTNDAIRAHSWHPMNIKTMFPKIFSISFSSSETQFPFYILLRQNPHRVPLSPPVRQKLW